MTLTRRSKPVFTLGVWLQAQKADVVQLQLGSLASECVSIELRTWKLEMAAAWGNASRDSQEDDLAVDVRSAGEGRGEGVLAEQAVAALLLRQLRAVLAQLLLPHGQSLHVHELGASTQRIHRPLWPHTPCTHGKERKKKKGSSWVTAHWHSYYSICWLIWVGKYTITCQVNHWVEISDQPVSQVPVTTRKNWLQHKRGRIDFLLIFQHFSN